MKLKIIRYNEDENYHKCRDEKNQIHRIDLYVCGDAPIKKYVNNPKDLDGKIVEISDLYPFIEIATDVIKITDK